VVWLILAALLGIAMMFAADAALAVASWLLALLDRALAPLGVHLPNYLDQLVPYMRGAARVMGLGLAAAAVYSLIVAIRERQ
jgi:phosphotransferase system  glucose/maltose/N-acetylglucosamine-specific IIC component